MKAIPLFVVTLAFLAVTGCKSRDPHVLNGRDRQPINVGHIVGSAAPTSNEGIPAFSKAPTEPPVAPQAASDAMPATTPHEIEPVPLTAVERAYAVRFDFGSAQLTVPSYISAEMLQAAGDAVSIVVNGRTDGARWSAGDERVALRRAIAGRDYLVNRGVPAEKIQLSYLSGGDYVADNSTSEGRSQNRRVEFNLVMPSRG